MSGANADRRDPADSVDEWRVDPGEPPKPGAESPDAAGEWSQAEASLRCARVSADLSSWREDLGERMKRLDERLTEAAQTTE
jgi:hypothetical protein